MESRCKPRSGLGILVNIKQYRPSFILNMLKFIANYSLLSLLLTLVTIGVQLVASLGNPKIQYLFEWPLSIAGNTFSWKLTGCVVGWAIFWLWVPARTYLGPSTAFGLVPIYKANGRLYYFSSLLILAAVIFWNPDFCTDVYNNTGAILGSLNVLAIALSISFFLMAKLRILEVDPYLKSEQGNWVIYEFCRGMDLHLSFKDINLKQLIITRLGIMSWQWLIVTYFVAGYLQRGLDIGHFVNVFLQCVSLYRFFQAETTFFNTLGMTLDRIGFYIIYGSLVGFPSIYTFSSYYFVEHETNCSPLLAVVVLSVGLTGIYFKYQTYSQKRVFRDSEEQYALIWGENPKSIRASYVMADGTMKMNKLLISGWWGVGRKLNYSFEMLAPCCWCFVAGFDYGFWPFLYCFFLIIFLTHRMHRDEVKCRTKYGVHWDDYCRIVPYRLIPGVF